MSGKQKKKKLLSSSSSLLLSPSSISISVSATTVSSSLPRSLPLPIAPTATPTLIQEGREDHKEEITIPAASSADEQELQDTSAVVKFHNLADKYLLVIQSLQEFVRRKHSEIVPRASSGKAYIYHLYIFSAY